MGLCQGKSAISGDSEALCRDEIPVANRGDAEVGIASKDLAAASAASNRVSVSSLVEAWKESCDWRGENLVQATSNLEWLNVLLSEIGPSTHRAVEKLLKEDVLTLLRESLPGPLRSIYFESCRLERDSIPVFGPVRVVRGKQLICSLGVTWTCDADISLKHPTGLSIGIRKIYVKAEVFIELAPIVDEMPIVGGLSIYMLSQPDIDWDFTGLANILDINLVARAVRYCIKDAVADNLILPRRVFIDCLKNKEDPITYKRDEYTTYPRPQAILRLSIVEARYLQGRDWNLFGKKTSDAYAEVRIGRERLCTSTVHSTLNPAWTSGNVADFLVYSPAQMAIVELFDHDLLSKDDRLGCVEQLTVRQLAEEPDRWWPLVGRGTPAADAAAAGEAGAGDAAGAGAAIRLVAELYALRPDAEILRSPPVPRGDARTVAVLCVKLMWLRGLQAEQCAGVKLRLDAGGKTLVSPPSRLQAGIPRKLADNDTVVRLIKGMQKEGLSFETIVNYSGLEEETVQYILDESSEHKAVWEESLILQVDSAPSSELKVEILLSGSSDAVATLPGQSSIRLADVMNAEGVTLGGPFKLQKVGDKCEHYHLEMELTLLGLCP
eukprot:TRINITY_DN31475_c0_g1_i1.p1 TRINITY_DN31475_c0_g1~~TRINITY_DN31475_c0_g1_i1.p1  ORF type:complete len:608 (-),score=122.07 TRINITY_DN31475_c0_g1_i1:264-2087(-)